MDWKDIGQLLAWIVLVGTFLITQINDSRKKGKDEGQQMAELLSLKSLLIDIKGDLKDISQNVSEHEKRITKLEIQMARHEGE